MNDEDPQQALLEIFSVVHEGIPPGDEREAILLTKGALECAQDLEVANAIVDSVHGDDVPDRAVLVAAVLSELGQRRRAVRAALHEADSRVRTRLAR